MSATPSTQSNAPPLWNNYLDLDMRAFDKTANRVKALGTMFTTNDRTQASQIVRRIIEKSLLPFSVQRI